METSFDTLAYMSCSATPANSLKRAVFSFRGGAYNTALTSPNGQAGLGLTQAMFTTLNPLPITSRVTALSKMQQMISTSIQFSMRTSSDVQGGLIVPSGGSGTLGQEYVNLLDTLDTQAIVQRLANMPTASSRVGYFSGIPGLQGRLLEGSLYYTENENIASLVRTQMNNGAYLTLTYTNALITQPYAAQAPVVSAVGVSPVVYAPASRAYGKGYNMAFTLDLGNYTSADPRVIDHITEVDLATGSTGGSTVSGWTCDPKDRFMIVRADDVATNFSTNGNNIPCNAQTDTQSISAAQTAAGASTNTAFVAQMRKVRNILRAEDWYVNLTDQCIVPKPTLNLGTNNDACYGPLPATAAGNLPVNYNRRTQSNSYSACPNTTNGMCPHYASICTRNQSSN